MFDEADPNAQSYIAHAMPRITWRPEGVWSRPTPVEKVIRFLAALSLTGSAGMSCRLAGILPKLPAQLRKEDPTFSDAYDAALDEAADRLEQEARRRAVSGVDRPVFQGGVQVGVVREYSDRLLEVMLRARVPAYADKPVTVNASQNALIIGAGPQLPRGEGLASWLESLSAAARALSLPAAPEPDTNGNGHA